MENENKQFGSLEDFENKVHDGNPPAPETPPVVETPPETPPAEAPKETPPVTETPPVGETPPAEGGEVPPAEEPPKETIFDINDFNQRFGTEFETEDTAKGFFEKAGTDSQRIVELEKQIEEIAALKQENLLLKENFDPIKLLGSEEKYRANLFEKQFPDKDASVAAKLLTTDVSTLSDKDAIAYQMMLDTPGLEKATVETVINDKYGIEEGEEIDALTKAKMQIDATAAKKDMRTTLGSVEVPEKMDMDSLTKQQTDLRAAKEARLSEGWQNISKEVAGTLQDVVITDKVDGKDVELFRYSIKDTPEDVVNQMAENMSKAGIEVTQENVQLAAEVMRQSYIAKNINTIIKASIDDQVAKAEEKRLKEQHNTGTPKPEAGTPGDGGKSDLDDKLIAGMGGFRPRPMF